MNTNRILLLVAGLFLALVWFNRQPGRPRPAAVAEKPAASKTAAPAVSVDTTLSEEPQSKHYRPRQVSEAVRRKVDAFIRRYKDAAPEEMIKSEEMTSMMERFTQMLDVPEFQREMEKRMDAIKTARGQEHGMLTIGTGKLDEPESRAWLEAMFSDDADLLKEYVLNKLDGAIFEFAFDPTLEDAGNGVKVQGAPSPAPAANKLPD